MISDSAVPKFRRSRSPSARVSSSAILPGWATNAWAMGASVDDAPTLSSLGGVVWTTDIATDALPPMMVRTYSGFWPWRLLCRRRPLWTRQSPAGQKGLGSRKPDHPVSQEAAVATGRQHELEALRSGSSTDQSRGSQGQTRLRGETSADGEAKPDTERNLEEVVVEQNKVCSVFQTGPSGFYSFRPEATVEDYRARGSSSTLLVFSRPHAQPDKEDPADEGAEDEGRSG
jgi:hypothetical protein